MIVQMGSKVFSKSDPEWALLTGSGLRIFDKTIPFRKGFTKKPKVMVALNCIDILKGANHRIKVKAKSIGRDQFEVQIHTWADTKVWAAGVSWIAIGE
jgi:hypothetical protein